MLLIYKNKGVLVPAYAIISLVFWAIMILTLRELIVMSWLNEFAGTLICSLAFLSAGVWTRLTYDSYYIANGRKKWMNEDNSFFFIPMKLWANIYLVISVMILVGSILEKYEDVLYG